MRPVVPMTKLGRLLVLDQVITEQDLSTGLSTQQETGRKLSQWLLEEGLVDEVTLARYVARTAGVPFVPGEQLENVPPDVASLLPAAVVARVGAVPAEVTAHGVVIATGEPEMLGALDALADEVGHPIQPALTTRTAVARSLAQHCGVMNASAWADGDAAAQAVAALQDGEDGAPGDDDPTQEMKRDDVRTWLSAYKRHKQAQAARQEQESQAPAEDEPAGPSGSLSPEEAVWHDETPADVPTVGIFVHPDELSMEDITGDQEVPEDLDDRATLAYRSPFADDGEVPKAAPDWEGDTEPPQPDPMRSTAPFGSKVPTPGGTPAVMAGPSSKRPKVMGVEETLDAVQSVSPESGEETPVAGEGPPRDEDAITTPRVAVGEEPQESSPEPFPEPPVRETEPRRAKLEVDLGAAAATPGGASFLDRYQFVDRLGVGGMAEVWRARVVGPEGFRRLVVIKKILPEYTTNREFVEMFIDEANIACLLSHPNIAQVYELAEDGGEYLIAMEYVDGPDLETIFEHASQEGPKLPPSIAAYIVEQLCSGLGYAHRKTDERGRPLGIVHRDVTPHNVLVSYEGHVKVIDFGIAKAAQKLSVTRVGYMKGKPGYIAPEQALGMKVDHRVDVFAAGILLFELITHRRLFSDAANASEFRKLAKFNPRPLLRWQLKIPSVLRSLAVKALQPKPGDRLESAQEMAAGLREYLRKRRRDPRDELVRYLRTHLPPVGGWEGPTGM